MNRLVTQGLLTAFLVFFYCATVVAEPRTASPVRLLVETDRDQLYPHSQLLITLHIFHDAPLPELVDIFPPQLEAGRVRTLGLPFTRLESDWEEAAFHTTQQFALFPDQPGRLSIEGPGLRIPAQEAHPAINLSAEIPVIDVLTPLNQTDYQLPSEQLYLDDRARQVTDDPVTYLRQLSLTAIGTLPGQLPDRLLNAGQWSNYQLIDRHLDEFHSRQGVTSQLTETWLITAHATTPDLHPEVAVHWWDTQANRLQYSQLPTPEMHFSSQAHNQVTAESTADRAVAESSAISPSASMTDSTSMSASPWHPFWLQGGIAAVLIVVGLIAGYFGFRSRPVATTQKSQQGTPKPATQPARPKAAPAATQVAPQQISLEYQAFMQLRDACQQNATGSARSALVRWAACFWPDRSISSPASIYQANVSQTLNYLLLDLEHHLKRPGDGSWQGDLLLEAVKTLRRRRGL